MPKPDDIPETVKNTVRRAATKLLVGARGGLRFSEIRERLHRDLPDVARGSIAGGLVSFAQDLPPEVLKPSRGFYIHAKFAGEAAVRGGEKPAPKGGSHREDDFYQPFADWIVNELEECTRAIPLGGKAFGSKWGTPDVIGVRAPAMGSLIVFPTEIVSAEVKTETSQLIVAFGQAVAYRLFSHKSYLVVPQGAGEEDIARLDVLARIVGIGLILFDAGSIEDPKFAIRVRAQKHEPDGFYLNDCVRHVQERLFR